MKKSEDKKRKSNKASVMERREEVKKKKNATCYTGELGYEANTRAISKTCHLH